MDAANRIVKTFSLPFLAAFLMAAGAQAQPALVASPSAITLFSNQGTSVAVTSTAAPGTQIPFQATTSYSGGDLPWLAVNGATDTTSATTPATLSFSVGQRAGSLSAGNHIAQVTLTPSAGSGASPIIITVSYSNSGPATGTISAAPASLFFNLAPGGTGQQSFSLSTTNSAPLQFTLTSAPPSWLTVSPTTGATANGSPQTVTLTASAANLFVGQQLATTLTFSYLANAATVQVSVQLNVTTNGGTGTLSASSTVVSWNYTTGSFALPASTFLTLSSSSGAPTFSAVASSQNNWLLVSSGPNAPTTSFSGVSLSGGLTLSASSNVTTLPVGVNVGTVVLTGSDGSQLTITVNLTVSGSSTVTGATIAPNSLTFAYQSTNNSPSSLLQQVIVGGSGSYSSSVAYTSGSGSQNWLSVTPSSGAAPQTTNVFVNPAGLTNGTYTAQISYATSSGTQSVSVTLLVSAGSVVYASPAVLQYTFQGGSAQQFSGLQILTSDGSALPVSATVSSATPWLSIISNGSTTPALFTVGFNGANLANGIYSGSINVSVPGATNPSIVVPVVMTVVGSTVSGGSLTISPAALTFTGQVNGVQPATQTIGISSSVATGFSVSTNISSTQNSINWLSVSQTAGTTPTNLTVSINQSGLGLGTYTGTIAITANGVTQTVPVTLVVSNNGGGSGNVTVTTSGGAAANSVNFSYAIGASTPASQTLNVTSASGSAPVSFNVVSSTQNGGTSWLSTNVASGAFQSTPFSLTVSVNPSGLTAAGSPYQGTIQIIPVGGATVNIPVTFTVAATPTVTATPTTLNFSYQAGNANPTPGTIQVSGGPGTPDPGLTFSATASSSTPNWLSVNPGTGTTPANVSVIVNPSSLAAGSYTGTVTISGTGTATGSTIVNVSLTVTAPLPTITTVVNAASFVGGGVSPGEIISIGGTSIGPATPATLTVANGQVATTLGGVQVFFNGVAAPLLYVSATQINAIVPYEIKGSLSTSVLVKFLGQSSNGFSLATATTAPGIFTQNASGTGPGLILNQDNTVNAPNNPAAKGSIIQVFMTGEGQTTPAGVTGKVNSNITNINQIPIPLLPVGVLVNNVPATTTFYGEAPNFVSGFMQVNVQIPSLAQLPASVTGAVPLVISVGGNGSQTGVTVSIK